ncbi:MAG: acylphosphatase [Bacteroidetes bacterium HGW-Bacteroidetes-22]|nr:MAG: acylphosphatase [Bacteroidetes bacterium HGW-Bacteroidetes-22]
MVRYLLIITGRVQGVGFRYGAYHQAISMGLNGYVRNLRDGSVEIEIEGEETSVERFILWGKTGPPHARVVSTVIEKLTPKYQDAFIIK